MTKHLASHFKYKKLRTDDTLHVIGVVTNPARYNSRYRLFRRWMNEMEKTKCVKLYIVEAVHGDRHFEVTQKDNVTHLRLFQHGHQECWIKENMINLGVRYLLPKNWKYMAWVDGDIHFRNHNWAGQTIHQLQTWALVQPFQTLANLGPTGEVLKVWESVGYKCQKGFDWSNFSGSPYSVGHTGMAWACHRDWWENIAGSGGSQGLMSWAILGSGDHHAALGSIGHVHRSYNGHMVHPNWAMLAQMWQQASMKVTHGTIGYTEGSIEHYFHGNMAKRYYVDRWKMIIDNNFDPLNDIKYDHQGLVQIVGQHKLQQQIKLYNRARQEDAVYND